MIRHHHVSSHHPRPGLVPRGKEGLMSGFVRQEMLPFPGAHGDEDNHSAIVNPPPGLMGGITSVGQRIVFRHDAKSTHASISKQPQKSQKGGSASMILRRASGSLPLQASPQQNVRPTLRGSVEGQAPACPQCAPINPAHPPAPNNKKPRGRATTGVFVRVSRLCRLPIVRLTFP